MLDPDSGGWSIARTEYLCGRGEARSLGVTRYDGDGHPVGSDPAGAEPYVLIPHIPDGAVYSVVCNDAAPGQVETADVAAAFARQAEDRRAYLDALAAAESSAGEEGPARTAAHPALTPAACSQSRLLNPFFAVAVPPHLAEGGADAVVRAGQSGADEELYGWRAAPGSTPGWGTTASADMGFVRLADGQGLTQGDLHLPAGRWRLTLGAGADRADAARLVARLGETRAGAAALGSDIAMHAIDFDLAADAQTLTLVAEGAGAVLVMACLDRLGDLLAG